MTRSCSKCGIQVQEGVDFCASCGQVLTQTAAPPVSPKNPLQPSSHLPQSSQAQQVSDYAQPAQIARPIYISGGLAIMFAVLFAVIGLQWWLVVLLAFGSGFGAFLRMYVHGKILAKRTWQCPHCQVRFKIDEWQKFVLAISRSHYVCRIRCPQCNELGWCKRVLKKDC